MGKRRSRALFIKQPQIAHNLYDLLSTGIDLSSACLVVGVAPSTVLEWVAIGRAYSNGVDHTRMPHYIKDRERFAEFAREYDRAEREAIANSAIVLKELMNDSRVKPETRARIAMWTLERRDPANWGSRNPADISPHDNRIIIEYRKSSGEGGEVRALVEPPEWTKEYSSPFDEGEGTQDTGDLSDSDIEDAEWTDV